MTEQAITGYATVGAFVVAALLAFAWARVRYWKRAYLEQAKQTADLLDRRSASADPLGEVAGMAAHQRRHGNG